MIEVVSPNDNVLAAACGSLSLHILWYAPVDGSRLTCYDLVCDRLFKSVFDWGFESEDEEHVTGDGIYLCRGKVNR